MHYRKLPGQLALGVALLSLASCRPGADAGVEPTPPLPASVAVISTWNQGTGALIDREERLVLTSAQAVGAQDTVEVIFAVVEDGKARIKRDYYMKQAARLKGRVLKKDKLHDLALLQVESVPEGMPELKLASALPEENAAVQTVVDTSSKSALWAPKSATVAGISDQSFLAPDNERVTAKMLEVTLDGKYAKASGGAPLVNESGEVVGIITSAAAGRPRLLAIEVGEARNLLSLVYRDMGTRTFTDASRKVASKENADKEFDMAISYCDKALKLNPNEALTHNERGAALSYRNKYDEAIAAYTEALKLNPRLDRALRNRASAYLHKGGAELAQKAVNDCTEAIKINSKYINAYQTRSVAYHKLNKPDLAKVDEEAVAELSRPLWKSSGSVPDR